MKLITPFTLLVLLLSAPVLADQPLTIPGNLNFEEGVAGASPGGWEVSASGEGTVALTMAERCPEGTRCARLTRKESAPGSGALVQVIRADPYRGKRLRLRAMLRAAESKDQALLYLEINLPASGRKSLRGEAAGTSWRTDEILADVPAGAETIRFGLVVTGQAEAWIDAVTVEILGDAGLGNEPARALTDRGATNLTALGRLVGRVRYFHPSDESASLDWPAWMIEAVGQVEGARDAADLASILGRLVRPIAPTAQIFQSGDLPPPTPPPSAPEARRVAWRHYGLGTGTARSQGFFQSRRVGGFAKPEGAGGALWILDASALQGSTVYLAAAVRAEWQSDAPGKGEIWISVVDPNGRSAGSGRWPVEEVSWRDAEIALPISKNAAKVYFGASLTGGGRLFLDSVRMTATGGPDAAPREVFTDGFETGMPGGYPAGWLVSNEARAAGYRVEVTEEGPREGRHALLIAWDLDVELPDPSQPLLTDLGGGVSLRLPLALFADRKGTLPHASGMSFERHKPEGFFPSGEDRATRLANVLLLWTALDRFYPYPLPADWSPGLSRALREAAKDKDERGFLDILRRLVASLRDNHATVSHASDPTDHRLPVLWRVIDDRLIITWADPALDTVRSGDVVEAVDGKSAGEALAQLEPLISAATPAYRRYRAAEVLSLAPKGAARTLRLRRGRAEPFSVTLHATAPFLGPDRLRGHRPEKIAEVRPGLFYLDLDRIDDSDFNAALPRLKEAKGLIFDLRGYPERISESFLAHLLQSPARTPGTRTEIRVHPDTPPVLDHLAWTIQPLAPRLTARAVFLTDERAYSRAETYLDIVSFHGLGEIVGTSTGGTNGEVNAVDLPGGYYVTWTGSRVERLSGKPLQGMGIPPTIPVPLTAEGVVKGRDEVLERAMALFDGAPM